MGSGTGARHADQPRGSNEGRALQSPRVAASTTVAAHTPPPLRNDASKADSPLAVTCLLTLTRPKRSGRVRIGSGYGIVIDPCVRLIFLRPWGPSHRLMMAVVL